MNRYEPTLDELVGPVVEDRDVAVARAQALAAMLREVATRGIQQARAELVAAEAEAAEAHDRLEAANAALIEWCERGEQACRLTAEAGDL